MNLLSLLGKKKSLKPQPNSKKTVTRKNPFHAVRVVSPSGRGCVAAAEIKGQAFLSAEAPQLPLNACSSPNTCACRYKHLSDRRRNLRRDADIGFPPARVTNERRQQPDRRRAS